MRKRNICFVLLVLSAYAIVLCAAQASGLAQTISETPAATPEPSWWKRTGWSDTVTVWKDILAVVAVVIGAIWAYFKFFKGRTFSHRLELKVVGRFIEKGDVPCLVASVQVKNIGLARVNIHEEYSRLEVSVYEKAAYQFVYAGREEGERPEIAPAIWTEPQPFQVFAEVSWLEPSEAATDEVMLTLPKSDYIAYKLDLLITSRRKRAFRTEERDVSWTTTIIFERREKKPK